MLNIEYSMLNVEVKGRIRIKALSEVETRLN